MRIETFKYLVRQLSTDKVVAGFNDAKDVVRYLKTFFIRDDYNVIDQDFTGMTIECPAKTFIEAYAILLTSK